MRVILKVNDNIKKSLLIELHKLGYLWGNDKNEIYPIDDFGYLYVYNEENRKFITRSEKLCNGEDSNLHKINSKEDVKQINIILAEENL